MDSEETLRPKPEDRPAWKKYWEERGQLWRIEPEIDSKRQAELVQFFEKMSSGISFVMPEGITTQLDSGVAIIHPWPGKEFRIISENIKLNRADVEFILSLRQKEREEAKKDSSNQTDLGWSILNGANLEEADLRG